jgi:hypothetical protein
MKRNPSTMRRRPFRNEWVVVLTIMAVTASYGQSQFERAEFLKSAAPGQKKGDSVRGILSFNGVDKEIVFRDKRGTQLLGIKCDSIKSLVYERTAKPRYAEGLLIAWPLMFTKSKKHYLTLQYEEPAGTGHFAILHLDKSNYQEILATVEAQTGKKVERTEEH